MVESSPGRPCPGLPRQIVNKKIGRGERRKQEKEKEKRKGKYRITEYLAVAITTDSHCESNLTGLVNTPGIKAGLPAGLSEKDNPL